MLLGLKIMIENIELIFQWQFAQRDLAEEIEDPFGTDDNDLPTDSLSEKIKGNVQEILS